MLWGDINIPTETPKLKKKILITNPTNPLRAAGPQRPTTAVSPDPTEFHVAVDPEACVLTVFEPLGPMDGMTLLPCAIRSCLFCLFWTDQPGRSCDLFEGAGFVETQFFLFFCPAGLEQESVVYGHRQVGGN